MTDTEWCRRVEQINWVLEFTGQREVNADARERLIKSDNELLGIKDE
jgi:hypothetical protein